MTLLTGSLARTINSALSGIFLGATLTRDVPGTVDPATPWIPATPVPTTFTCKAVVEQYGVGHKRNGLVVAGDVKVLVLAESLSTQPEPLDRITILEGPGAGETFTVVPASTAGWDAVRTDPARAVWELRARK